MKAQLIKYEVVYNGKDITKDILPFVISFNYTDKANAEADELELTLEDTNKLWQNDWFPVKGDSITAKIIDEENGVLNCGTFTIDELESEGGDQGDTFKIKAISTGINKKLRTKNSFAHENKTLREIANTIAAKHGLSVEGSIEEIRVGRITQYHETDLAFLKRISFEYGYTFSIKATQLVFTNIFDLEKKKAALSFQRNELISWSIKDKTAQTFKGANIAYHNPREKKVIEQQQTETEQAYQGAKVDTLELRMRAENQQQAEVKSRVALYRANSLQQEGTVEIPGNIFVIAGNNCELLGLGVFSGLYYLDSSTHSVDKDGGYKTTATVKRVGLVDKEKRK